MLAALCGVGLLSAPGCNNEEAILLLIRPPSGVQLTQYEVKIQDRASRTLIYQSGIQPVAAVASGRDLTLEPLRLGLKLSKAGSFLVFVRAATGLLAPDGTKQQQRTPEYFFATITDTAGTTEVNGSLLLVEPDYDRDQDHFPDAITWPMANLSAKVQYQSQKEVLDCVDQDPPPSEPQLPAGLYAQQINPLATPRCGLAIDVACAATAPACKDADGDGENESTDCDDADPARFHKNPRPRNCCTCTDRKSCATDHGKRADQASCQPARCDNSFDFNCSGQVVPCFVDEDCDGYSPNDPVPSQRDCDDTNPDVHPGAAKKCSDSSHDWACDGNPRGGCVACDLDGDGYQRLDPAASCPDNTDIHPGQLDCDDDDRGVFPGATSYAGATLIISDLKQKEGGGSVAAALRRLCFNKALDGKAQDADCNKSLQDGCPPLPAAVGGKICDGDGDGFPTALAGCNPSGLPVDCDDTDYKTFPGAPDKCGDGKAQNCSSDTACSMDVDKDGYNADVDCDDNDVNRHPWATELCNGVDDDCDGLIDELNPDPSGARMAETKAGVTKTLSCNDNKVGDCGTTTGGFFSGRCVCSGVVAGKHAVDPGRQACPGTRDDAVIAPKCFGAIQPGQQTCLASQPHDEDCDGRMDAPDGVNLKEKTDACGIVQGECKNAGAVIGCDRSKINRFSKMATPSFAVSPPFDEERRFLVCDAATLYPSTELCDGLDNDCNAVLDDCAGPGLALPKCCAGLNMCIDLSTNFDYCGSCTGACKTATASACVNSQCMCGANPACSGARGLCNGTACVQCLVENDCAGVAGKTHCKNKDTCVQCLSNADCDPTSATPACNTTTNTCVPCFANSDCMAKDPTKPVCDIDGGFVCRACLTDAYCTAKDPTRPVCDPTAYVCGCKVNTCPAATPECDPMGSVCRECVGNAECLMKNPAKPQCDTGGGHVCQECASNTYCTAKDPTRPVCDPMTRVCNCAENNDCPTGTPKCVGAVCRECMGDTECKMKDPTKPVCDPVGGYVCRQCVDDPGCVDFDPTKPVCDITGGHVCRACTTNAYCKAKDATKPVCDATRGYVCGCTDDTDCAAVAGKTKCDTTTSHSCVECFDDMHCSSGMTCTNNACVP